MINFNKTLHSIIRETKYLDAMGFQLPEVALNVALQDEKYRSYIENISLMLQVMSQSTPLILYINREKELTRIFHFTIFSYYSCILCL